MLVKIRYSELLIFIFQMLNKDIYIYIFIKYNKKKTELDIKMLENDI
jgi:hypothetical protein